MENTNPNGKRLSELVRDAGEMQVVIIGIGAEVGVHAALIASLANKPDVVMIAARDLNEEDQKLLQGAKSLEDILPKPDLSELVLKMTREIEPLPEIVINSFNTKENYHSPKKVGLPNPVQKQNRKNFQFRRH